MPEQKSSIFRKESLERLSSPERLDQLMQIVSPQDWLSLATLGGLVVLGLIWSIVGRIPIAVQGQGLLMRPRRVVEVQSPVSGELQELQGQVGDCFGQDNSIALINPSQSRRDRGNQGKRPEQPNLPGSVRSTIKSQYKGCILEVKASPGQIVSAGTPIATMLVEASSEPMVGITYFTLKDGQKIKPGMEIKITPDTVERSRFGAILGKVTSVSPFPVTKEKITSIARNSDVVGTLIGEEVKIEAIAQLELDPDSFSGYKWTSSGGPPNLEITSGTTTTVRVRIEERAPITFVLPFLREWSGID